ncbi:HDOD domain-containing protein [Pseudorhodoferax sp. Leaf267]|uniref:HDOD domain-containing protein n=1 Tax=Pseudorhodoferax sp. Leaf267 TaxID=1736316 RepID=UPI000701339A|nr:HDOD domain-containing protein [Pseudorhodoferax sp. Leaf267]KQP15205.1 histidine kinase [Pseudorhodoferax sp. Leaf267]
MELDVLLSREPQLPSLPKVVALLLSELARPQPDLRKLQQLFSADPALAMRLLRLANQDAGPDGGGVTSIAQALAMLEAGALREPASAAARDGASRQLPLTQFWRYSVHVAKLSRALAASVRQNQATAFTTGLVHAIGELLLYAGASEDMASLDLMSSPVDLRRARLEQRMFGYCYADVGAALAQQWQFPAPVVDALRHQTAPFDNEVYEPLAGVVHLATWRARAHEAGLNERALATSFPGEVGLALGLDIDMVLQQDPIDWSARAEPHHLL